MRIAIIADALDFQYAGIRIYTRELIRALGKVAGDRHEILIVRAFEGKEFENVRELVLPVLQIPGYQVYRLNVQIPLALRKLRPDVVIEPRHVGPFNLPRKVLRATVIHDLTWKLFPEYHIWLSQRLQRAIVPWALRKTDLIIANSKHTEQDIRRHYPFTAQKTRTIYPGRESLFTPTKEPGLLEQYHIGQPYFLYLGTLEPRKNLVRLVEAYNLFRSWSSYAHQLVLVGKLGWKAQELLEAIDNSPYRKDIIQTGFVTAAHLPVLYTMAEAFVYPSLYEGFGFPVLEAFCCQTPVLCSDRSSLPEVAGDAALFFDPLKPASIAARLLEIVQSPHLQAELVARGSKRALCFSWEIAARQLLQELETIQK